MNRRLVVFTVVFLIVSAAGLAYTYSLAPVYVGTARVQVEPGTGTEDIRDTAVLAVNEAHALTSNEMLERLLDAMRISHPAGVSAASVPVLREMQSASAPLGSNIIELQARGSRRDELQLLLHAWAAAYLDSRAARRTSERDSAIEEACQTVDSIAARVAQKRRELDDFRRRHSIVSTERDENQAAAQIKSMNTVLSDARSKLMDAESRLHALKAAVTEGKHVYRSHDKVLISQLEHRA